MQIICDAQATVNSKKKTLGGRTSNENRFYHRPYEASIKVPVDLSVEAVSIDTENRGLRAEYTAWGFRAHDVPLCEAFWATGPSVSDIIADARIDAWAPSTNEASRLIGLSELANAPADATHIVVIADRENQFTEADISDDRLRADLKTSAPASLSKISPTAQCE